MAILKTYFAEFLTNIRPTKPQRDNCKTGHETLRKRLYDDMKGVVIDTFLQGSYRRSTAVRPTTAARSDVDVITVTNLDKNEYTPKEALALFEPFLDKHYEGNWKAKGRSFGIELSYVDLDLVITAAPSEVYTREFRQYSHDAESIFLEDADYETPFFWVPEGSPAFNLHSRSTARKDSDWKLDPLDIPDRDADEWDETHPLAQIAATWDKNRATNKHFVNVVKCLKWWKLLNHPEPKHPKGYPMEHLLWISCPNGVDSVAQGFTEGLEDFVQRYRTDRTFGNIPNIPDHGVPSHNVLGRLSVDEFQTFYDNVEAAAVKAREAIDCENECDSADLWRELFGIKFPECKNRQRGYTPRTEPGEETTGGRFANRVVS